MLLGISTIIFKLSHSLDLIIFRYSISEPRVAYKSVAYKKKRVITLTLQPKNVPILKILSLISFNIEFSLDSLRNDMFVQVSLRA